LFPRRLIRCSDGIQCREDVLAVKLGTRDFHCTARRSRHLSALARSHGGKFLLQYEQARTYARHHNFDLVFANPSSLLYQQSHHTQSISTSRLEDHLHSPPVSPIDIDMKLSQLLSVASLSTLATAIIYLDNIPPTVYAGDVQQLHWKTNENYVSELTQNTDSTTYKATADTNNRPSICCLSTMSARAPGIKSVPQFERACSGLPVMAL